MVIPVLIETMAPLLWLHRKASNLNTSFRSVGFLATSTFCGCLTRDPAMSNDRHEIHHNFPIFVCNDLNELHIG